MALTVSVDEIVEGSLNQALGARPHWERIRLGEIASVLNGCAFKSAQFTKGDGMPLIRIRDVGSDSTDTNYAGEFDDRYVVESGDLLIGMDGDFNCARWRGPRGLLNQRVCKVTLQGDQYHPRFLDFALPGYLKAINDATSSVTVKHLSSRTIEDIPLPLPPRHEQEEIVAELEKQFSRLDEAVANLKRVRGSLSRFQASALSEAAGSDGRWTTCRIADLLCERIVNGLSVKESTTPTSVRALRLSAMSEKGLDYADHRFLPVDPASVDDILVEEGDFFVSRGNGSLALVGRGATAQAPPFPVIFPDTMMRLRFHDAEVRRWVAALWPSRLVRRQIEQRVKTTAGIYKIAQPQVASISVPLPPASERERIVAEVDRRLSIVREVEAEVDANLKRAQALRQAVLAKAFQGS
jgi:type I restriction enzyme, S subunit